MVRQGFHQCALDTHRLACALTVDIVWHELQAESAERTPDRLVQDRQHPGPDKIDVASQIVLPAIAAMANDPSRAPAIISIDQAPVPFANGPELFESIVTALVGAARSPDVLELMHGQVFLDNSSTQYTGTLPAATLLRIDANIQGVSTSPAGLSDIEHNYTPTGPLTIPALMLSTFRDPVAPGIHAALYASAVAAAGDSNWLVQRRVPGTVSGYGHCTFTPQELPTTFMDLVLWARYGMKPTP